MKKTLALLLLLAFPATAFAQTSPTLELLRDLIRIDTSNPPGNETSAARYVKEVLAEEGIASEIIESAPGRGNLIARLKGDGSKPALILLGHLDVVPADPGEWDHPPFEPEIRDGDLWGRGALDMKSLVAMEIEAVLRLKRENAKLAGDVVLVLTADEEAGGKMGAKFLVENHWDKIEAKYVFNEGSVGVEKMGMRMYSIQVAEKGVAWFKLTARGASGHGSMPSSDNAVAKLARAVDALATHRFPVQETPILKEFLVRASAKMPWWKRVGVKALFAPGVGPILRKFAAGTLMKEKAIRAVLTDTVAPTMLTAGYKVNVIPAEASASLDARILPGHTPEAFLDQVRGIVAEVGEGFEVEPITSALPNESDFRTPYFEAIEAAVRKQDPEAVVAPIISAGATDSRFFREKGVISYGIIPLLLRDEHLGGLHGKNERIPVEGVEKGTEIVYDIVMKMQGAQ